MSHMRKPNAYFFIPTRRKKGIDSGLKIHIDGKIVEQVWVFKYLGVMLIETLTWSDHIDMVCGKVTRSLNLLRRLSCFLPRSLLHLYLLNPIFCLPLIIVM